MPPPTLSEAEAEAMTATTTTTTISKIDQQQQQQNETEIFLLEMERSSNDDDVDDAGSVSSSSTAGSISSVLSGYFDPSDFMPWEELYARAEYAPHVGFAMVAGGFACLHPILFFAGVVTALGALRAATHTYEYAMCNTTEEQKQKQLRQQQQQQQQLKKEDTSALSDCLPSIIGFNNSCGISSNINTNNNVNDIEKTEKGKGGIATVDSIITDDDDSVPALAKTTSSSSTVESTNGNVVDRDGDVIKNNTDVVSSSVPSIFQSPPKRQIQIEDESSSTIDPIKWIKDNHPNLSAIALDHVEFRGLNANEFFDVFFADDAPFGFPAFHKLRRDKEVQYGTWDNSIPTNNYPNDDMNNNNVNVNVIPSSIVTKERAVEYHAKNNAFLGPPYALTSKTQRAYFVSKKLLVIEIKTTLKDIPFCNRFYLIERWIVDGTGTSSSINSKNNNKNRKHTTKKQQHNTDTEKDRNHNPSSASSSHCIYLTVTSKCFFTEECPFESAIVKESAKQIGEISKCWYAMAQDGLKRTEETRTKRLRQQQQRRLQKEQQMKDMSLLSTELVSATSSTTTTNNFDNDESIEIEHVDDNDRSSSGSRSGTRRRSSTSQQQQQQQQPQPQPHRLLKNRSLSRSFSKLLVRNSTINAAAESNQAVSIPKVRISSSSVIGA
jgi:hypothetical protein